jgi:Resolvase, N terminal domain
VSGGALDRPDLQRFLTDIDRGLVDVVVVYKIDRLSRPLSRGAGGEEGECAPKGAVRGWANATCNTQLVTCDFSRDVPWSPPALLPPE